jgi:hypothetical protein
LEFLNNKHRATLDALKAGKLTDEITDVIQTVAKEISVKYLSEKVILIFHNSLFTIINKMANLK